MLAGLAGALFAFGILVLLQGAFPSKPDLRRRLAAFNDHELAGSFTGNSLIESLAVTLLETVKGEDMAAMLSDLEVTDTPLAHIALEKVKAGAGAGALAAFAGVLFGFVSGPLVLFIVAVIGAVVGYVLPDMELKKKAEARRIEFTRALTAFVTLLGSSISGGGGINTAMADAAAMGDGWVFVKLRNALDEAKLTGISPWLAFEQLGRELRVVALIELAGSLTLAGASGARVTETLHSRAESSRDKEISDARAEAEAKSSTLGVPVGLMLLAWAGFMGYPAILNMMGF